MVTSTLGDLQALQERLASYVTVPGYLHCNREAFAREGHATSAYQKKETELRSALAAGKISLDTFLESFHIECVPLLREIRQACSDQYCFLGDNS